MKRNTTVFVSAVVFFLLTLTLTGCERKAPQSQRKVVGSIADLIPEGWEVLEDVAPSEFKVAELEFVSFLEKGERCVSGEEMRRRAIQLKANFGLADGKYLLDHQDEIPAELRGNHIVLTGTLLRPRGGGLSVPALGWHGGRWGHGFVWRICDCCGGPYRLPRRK